jgi:hypothetical protein
MSLVKKYKELFLSDPKAFYELANKIKSELKSREARNGGKFLYSLHIHNENLTIGIYRDATRENRVIKSGNGISFVVDIRISDDEVYNELRALSFLVFKIK